MLQEDIYKVTENGIDINFDSIESFYKENGYECKIVPIEVTFRNKDGKAILYVSNIKKRADLSEDEIKMQDLSRENRELKYKIAKMSNEIQKLKEYKVNDTIEVDIVSIPHFLGETLPERLKRWLELKDRYNILLLDNLQNY